MRNYQEDLGWNVQDKKDMPYKVTFTQAFLTFFLPALSHFTILYAATHFDPCNGNPGCMAGTLSIYFFIFISLPTLVLLLISTLIQVMKKSLLFKRMLSINMTIALVPMIASAFVIIVWQMSK